MTCNEFRIANATTAKFLTLTKAERLASSDHYTNCVGCRFWMEFLTPDPSRDYAADAIACRKLWEEDHGS